jgi:general secretion pathway protein D
MKASNALLVDARPGDFQVVKKLVDQIDRAPDQVHIEVLIAEIGSDKGLEWGVEMAAVDMPTGVGDTVLQGGSRFSEGVDSIMNQIQNGIFPRGLSIGVAHGSALDASGRVVPSYPALLNFDAIQKTGEVKLRSRPSLVAQDNEEASISIVEEIPVLKSTIQGTEAGRDVIQNIERMDVGIKLKLTPHVIDGKKVRMDLNPSIEAVIDPGPAGTQFAPTIAKREVATTVTVPNGQVIVIAGLTRENKTKIVKKTPILGSIPLLGLLFRHSVDVTEKTDLVIFVLPRIISDEATADSIKKAWQKVGLTPDRKK